MPFDSSRPARILPCVSSDPKKHLNLIRDPIHDYVPFTVGTGDSEAGEKDILVSRWVQRLRRVFQLQSAWLVYPGATHTRFLHSAGAMHLAGRFAETLYERFVENFPHETIPEKNHVIEVFRLAGLLHDLGHSSFGHTFDQVYSYPRYKVTHEDIGQKILRDELGDIIRRIRRPQQGRFEQAIDPETVINFIKPTRPYTQLWEKAFSKILFGLYSVDKLDYLVRDAYFTGTREYGTVDINRLLYTSTVTEEGLTLHASAASALKSFLFSRLLMYENVYYHKAVRLFDIAFAHLLEKAYDRMDLGNPLENLEGLYDLDDFSVYAEIKSWRKRKDPEEKRIGEAWLELLNRNNPWKEAYRLTITYAKTTGFFFRPTTPAEVEVKLRQEIPAEIPLLVDMPYLDVRPENPLSPLERKNAIAIYDPTTGRTEPRALQHLVSDLPVKFHALRVFAHPEHRARVHEVAHRVLGGYEVELQESSF